MRRIWIGVGLAMLLMMGGGGTAIHAQPDSVRAKILEAKGFSPNHSPRGALWRAAAVPGWGQFYNHQYYKIPFVYAGLAGGGVAIYVMNRRYLLYRHAHLYKVGQRRAGENGENPYQQFKEEYDQVVRRVGGELSGRRLRTVRDKFRRWRDLSILGTGLFYALTILDAYISAHLLAFDVGQDAALSVRPVGGLPSPVQRGRASSLPSTGFGLSGGAGLRVRVRF